uniref:Uncharacterized protein n=1 Tax=viral metagenome TaxID=1070528 RepID=A0A6C0B9K7_9ZZZZ
MGNQSSHQELPELPEESLHRRLDYIATHYILTMDFKSLQKMYEKSYCNQLVLITSNILDTYFTDLEIERIGKEKLGDESVLFFHKSDVPHMDEQSKEKRITICKQIAQFYIKIAHIFAAIVMTINPEYTYTNNSGKLVKKGLYEKENIPKHVKVRLSKTNICDERIELLKKAGIEQKNPFCSIDHESLEKEPGIPELIQLYMDAKFDYQTGNFTDMSPESREHFLRDLKLFYKAFTGEEEMPDTITSFADIKLQRYGKNSSSCKKGGTSSNTSTSTSTSFSSKENEGQTIMTEYAENLKQMIAQATEKQEKLLDIINQLFVSDNLEKKFIRVHPDLNKEKLQEIVEDARQIIIELYLQCEIDFTKGIHLYESIVESRMLVTTQRQIDHLQKSAEWLIQRETEQQRSALL